MKTSRDTLEIVGAGPSGLAAAIVAARAGRTVVVNERHLTVGARFKGDFQGLENWTTATDVLDEFRAAGIEPTFEAAPVREQHCFGPDGREHQFRSQRPFYYLVRRGPDAGTLDTALFQQAVELGVDVRFGRTVRDAPRSVISAHGPRSTTILVAGMIFETDLSDRSLAILGGSCAPGGYGYLLVNRGRATLACCIFKDFRNAKEYLARTERFIHERVSFAVKNPKPFGGFGTAFVPRPAEFDARLRAGEASGVQDALWGFGIRSAVRSGVLAGRGDTMSDLEYRREWSRQMGARVKTGIVNRFFLDHTGDLAYRWLLRRLAASREPWEVLRDVYAPVAWKRALFPIADRLRASRSASLEPG